MIIDLRALLRRGLTEQSFDFKFSVGDESCLLPGGRFDGQAEVSCTVEIPSEDKTFVFGSIRYRVSAECSRCLAPVSFERVVEFDETFVDSKSGNANPDCYVYSNDKIDLTEMVEQTILTDMPYAVLCKEDCKGLCPKCGHNLNDGDCGCEIL